MSNEYETEYEQFDDELDRQVVAGVVGTLVELRKGSDPLIRQVDVAKRMGIGQPSVSEFERGEFEPKISTIQRYARAVGAKLKLSVEYEEAEDSGSAE